MRVKRNNIAFLSMWKNLSKYTVIEMTARMVHRRDQLEKSFYELIS